ncbi:MAG: hypothetical protein M3155_03330 [Actinomycetota bacterium]|nr:hypothetical protein [Actinomycetota bacterium]
MLNRGKVVALVVSGLLGWLAVAVPAPAAAASKPLSYLVSTTNQLGFPGQAAGTLVTPEGDLFTGWAELTFSVGDGRTLDPLTHSLFQGRFPVVHMFREDGDLLYELDAYETVIGGRPVTLARIQITNQGNRVAHGRLAAAVRYDGGEFGVRGRGCCIRINRFPRPRTPDRDGLYFQPGMGFSGMAAYSLQGTTLLRDGQALVVFPGAGSGIRLTQQLQTELAPFNTRSQFGRHRYDVVLRPHQRRALSFTMPVEPLAPTDPQFGVISAARFDQYRAITLRAWRGILGGAMKVALPERKVTDAFYASIMNDALARYRLPNGGLWVQTVNNLRYHSFYLRDAAFINQMYLLVGLSGLARENLDFFFTWQRDDGLFISRPEEYDGFGQALWAFGEYVRRTGNTQFARDAMPAISKAMAWFEGQRANDPLGLLPAVQNPGDNELIPGHLAGDNFLAAAGVAGAVSVARAAGDEASANRWQGDYDAFLNVLRGRIFSAQKSNGGIIPPALDNRGGQDWGNLWAAYPWPVLSPDSVVVKRTLAHARRKFREGIATYADTALLHGYLGFRVFETELLAGRQKNVVEGLYSELAHTDGSNGGFEAGTAPYGDRVVDDTTVPHGWFGAEYATLLRNMLVREDGSTVHLMSAVSPAWLQPGKRISVSGAPTERGPVSFTLTSTGGGATLSWSSRLAAGTRVVWPVPYLARGVSARGLNRRRGEIVLPGRSGSLSVRWRIVGTPPTYERAFRGLMTAYFNSQTGAAQAARARGALPLVPSLTKP